MANSVVAGGVTLTPGPILIKGTKNTEFDPHYLPLNDAASGTVTSPKIKMKGRGSYTLTLSGEIHTDLSGGTTLANLEGLVVYTQTSSNTLVITYDEWPVAVTYYGVFHDLNWSNEAGQPARIPYSIEFTIGSIV